MTGGLHGKAERGARGVTVYLVPGLTAGQRRAVIRRLRQEASRGLSPRLPLPHLAIAFGLARARSAARIVGAMVRLHPAATLVPGAFVVALMALFVVVSAGRPGIAQAPGLSGTEAAASGSARVAGQGGGRLPPYLATTTDGGGKAIGAGPSRRPVFLVTANAGGVLGVDRARRPWGRPPELRSLTGLPWLAGPRELAGQSLSSGRLPAPGRSRAWPGCSHGRLASRGRA